MISNLVNIAQPATHLAGQICQIAQANSPRSVGLSMLRSRLLLAARALASPIGLNPQVGKLTRCELRVACTSTHWTLCTQPANGMCLHGVVSFFLPCNVLAITSEALDLENVFCRTDKMGSSQDCCRISLLIDCIPGSLWCKSLYPAARYPLNVIDQQHPP